MKNITRHTGTLEIINRLPSSRNGNPRYRLKVDGYVFVTPVDSSYGYSITNFEGKRVDVTIGSHFGVLSLNDIREGS